MFGCAGIGETHILDHGVQSENGNDECKLWEGMEGVVWIGVNENY